MNYPFILDEIASDLERTRLLTVSQFPGLDGDDGTDTDFSHFNFPRKPTSDYGQWSLFPAFLLNVKKWRIVASASIGDISFSFSQVIPAGDRFDQAILDPGQDEYEEGNGWLGGPTNWYKWRVDPIPFRRPRGFEMYFDTIKTKAEEDGSETRSFMNLDVSMSNYLDFRPDPITNIWSGYPNISVSVSGFWETGTGVDYESGSASASFIQISPSGVVSGINYVVTDACSAMGIPMVARTDDTDAISDLSFNFSMTVEERYGPDEW